MSITARGRLTVPLATLRTMLSECASVQKLLQAANAAAAAALIHLVSAPGDAARPLFIIDFDEWSPEVAGGGTRLYYTNLGRLSIYSELATQIGGTVTSETDASNFVDTSLIGLKDDHLNELQLTMLDGDREGETARVSDFNGTTGAIVLATPLSGAPGVGSTFRVEGADGQDVHAWALNVYGDILDELLAQSGTGGKLALREPRIDGVDWVRADDAEEDVDHLMAAFTFGFGR